MQIVEANEFVNRALVILPDNAEAWLLKAQILSTLGDDFAALAAVEVVLHKQPGLAEAHYWRAAMLADLDRHQEALEAVNQAFNLLETSRREARGPTGSKGPTGPKGQCSDGSPHGPGQRDDEALLEDLYYEKALIQEALGDSHQAIATFREGLTECPSSTVLKSLERERVRAQLKVIPGGLCSLPANLPPGLSADRVGPDSVGPDLAPVV